MQELEIGSIVQTTSGRDAKNHFVVVEVLDEKFVKICDGKYHKLQSPKKKNIRHIKLMGLVNENLKQKLIEGKKVFDSELKSFLNSLENVD